MTLFHVAKITWTILFNPSFQKLAFSITFMKSFVFISVVNSCNVLCPFALIVISSLFEQVSNPSISGSWGRIFSCVQTPYERAVSELDRSIHTSLWASVAHNSFIEGSHTNKNTASESIVLPLRHINLKREYECCFFVHSKKWIPIWKRWANKKKVFKKFKYQ